MRDQGVLVGETTPGEQFLSLSLSLMIDERKESKGTHNKTHGFWNDQKERDSFF